MLQTKKAFLAISLCVLGLVTSLLLIYPGLGMPRGDYHDMISGVLIVEPCEGQIMPVETKYVSLPHREERFQDGLKCYRFETMLPTFTFSGNLKLLLNVQGRFHEMTVNGSVIATVSGSDENHKIVRHSPLSLLIPKTLLRKQDNRLSVRYVTYDPVIAISGMGIGPVDKVDGLYWALYFVSDSFIYAMNFLLLLIGLYLVNFSLIYRDEKLLGLAGRSMLILSFLCSVNLAPEIPAFVYPLWRAILLVLSAGLTVTIIEFMLVYADKKIKAHEKTLMHISILFMFFSARIFDDQFTSFVSFSVMLLFNLYCLVMIFSKQVRQKLFKSALGVFYFISFFIAYMTFMHDFMLMPGHGTLMEWLHKWFFLPPLFREEIFISHAGVIMLFFSMVMIVVERYQAVRDYAEKEADRIYGALTHNEAELRKILDQQHMVQTTHIIQHERQRLLFEIHTGIGLRLQEGYQRAVQDRLTPAQFVDVFQDCIDDMRLIMDCISMRPRAEIDIIIGSILHRMQPRMVRQGIELYVEPHRRLGEGNALTDVQCLYVGRIIQAGLMQALRLPGCTKVMLASRETKNSLFIGCYQSGEGLSRSDFHDIRQSHYNELQKRASSLNGRFRMIETEKGLGLMLFMKRRKGTERSEPVADPVFMSLVNPA